MDDWACPNGLESWLLLEALCSWPGATQTLWVLLLLLQHVYQTTWETKMTLFCKFITLKCKHHTLLELGESDAINLEKRKVRFRWCTWLSRSQVSKNDEWWRERETIASTPQPPKYRSVESQLGLWFHQRSRNPASCFLQRIAFNTIKIFLLVTGFGLQELLWKGEEKKKRAYGDEGQAT